MVFMQQTSAERGNITSSYRDPEAERVEKRLGLLNKVNGIIWFVFAVLEIIIGMRVVLKLLGANPENAFASFVYDLAHPFLVPFFGIVDEPQPTSDSVLEVSSIIAMVVYLLIAWGIIRLLTLIMTPADAERVYPGA